MLEYFIKEAQSRFQIERGWGNGYIIIPKNRLYNIPDDENDINVYVHGGFTLSYIIDKNIYESFNLKMTNAQIGDRLLGFDTCHYNDTIINWPKDRVEEETKRIAKEIYEIYPSLEDRIDTITEKLKTIKNENV